MKRRSFAAGLLLWAGCANVDHVWLGELPAETASESAQDAASDGTSFTNLGADAQLELPDAAVGSDGGVQEMPEAGAAIDASTAEAATPNDASRDAESTQHDDDDDKHDAALNPLCMLEPWHCQ